MTLIPLPFYQRVTWDQLPGHRLIALHQDGSEVLVEDRDNIFDYDDDGLDDDGRTIMRPRYERHTVDRAELRPVGWVVSSARQHNADGLVRVWDELRNRYVTANGEPVTFHTAYEAEQAIFPTRGHLVHDAIAEAVGQDG